MSSAQERPSSGAGTTGPTGSSTGTGAGDMADRDTSAGTGATSTGTSGYERVGAQRGPGYEERGPSYEEAAYESPARFGGMMLAAVLMIFSGLVTFFYGIVGVIHGAFFVTVNNYVFNFNASGRGIVNLVLGALIFAAGVCLVLGMLWARIVGVVLAVLSGVYNFLILPWYPIWAIILVALNVYIIWALVSGGRSRRVEA
jgi:hypothetical protein